MARTAEEMNWRLRQKGGDGEASGDYGCSREIGNAARSQELREVRMKKAKVSRNTLADAHEPKG